MPIGATQKVKSPFIEVDETSVSTISAHTSPVGPEIPAMTDLLADASLYVRFLREHGQWYAEATDYSVVGIGASREEAVESMLQMLQAYLRYERKHGRDAKEARRSQSRLASIKIRALAALSRLVPSDHRRALRMRLSR